MKKKYRKRKNKNKRKYKNENIEKINLLKNKINNLKIIIKIFWKNI